MAAIWWVSFFMGFGIFPIVLDWNTPVYDVYQGMFIATFVVLFSWIAFKLSARYRRKTSFD